MKVGVASAYFATMRGGGEQYTLKLSEAIARREVDLEILCGRRPFRCPMPLSVQFPIRYAPQWFAFRNLGNKNIHFVSAPSLLLHHIQYSWSCLRQLQHVGGGYELIHTHDPSSMWAAVQFKRKRRVPIVSSFHGPPDKITLKLAKEVDMILPVSEAAAQPFRSNGFSNVQVIPGGVDMSTFYPMDREGCRQRLGLHGKVLLFVGRLMPVKNLETLLNAFPLVLRSHPDAKLVIVGEGPMDRALRKSAAEKNIEVRFEGPVHNELLPIYYNAADCLVLPSHYESYSLVALEAMACGTPLALTTSAQSIIQKLGEKKVSCFSPGIKEELATAVIAALDESRPTPIETMERAEPFSWDKIGDKVVRAYQKVIS